MKKELEQQNVRMGNLALSNWMKPLIAKKDLVKELPSCGIRVSGNNPQPGTCNTKH